MLAVKGFKDMQRPAEPRLAPHLRVSVSEADACSDGVLSL